MDNDHQRPEYIHSNGDKALFAFGAFIFHRERERIAKHPVALGKRHTVLLDVCRVLLRVEIGGHDASICTLYIQCQTQRLCWHWLSTNVVLCGRPALTVDVARRWRPVIFIRFSGHFAGHGPSIRTRPGEWYPRLEWMRLSL